MDIYWIQDGKKCGPATVPDVMSRIELGELTPETKAWHAGCTGWVPLRELPAMVDFLNPAADEETAAPADEARMPFFSFGGEEPEKTAEESAEPRRGDEAAAKGEAPPPAVMLNLYLPSPGVRALARLADVALYAALVYLMIYVRQIPFSPAWMPTNPLLWLPFVVLEAAMLTFFGTTPGKWLLGIRLMAYPAVAPTFLQCLNRAMLVFICGTGMMCSFLPLIFGCLSLYLLRVKGFTLWDARCATIVYQPAKMLWVRALPVVLLVFVCYLCVNACMQPWLPDIVKIITEESPEMGAWMQQMLSAQGQ